METGSPWQAPNGTLTNTVVLGGSAASPLGNPLLVFSDTFFTMRYRAKTGNNMVVGSTDADWSEWADPVFVPSWVKRVLDGINPFNQRVTDLANNAVNTDVSVVGQAGGRWEGNVALNLSNINDFGLIEIYETVLNRVKAQSIDGGTTTPAVNNTLLLVAGYLSDLYMLLGNEAADDAINPTLQIDGDGEISNITSARFSFEGQVASVIDETITLWRGRDDTSSTKVSVAPVYNRLYWNYTNGIRSGEPIYATNYNLKEKSGKGADGVINELDAARLFPQGHGDAYGHYLTALTGYYKLLTNSTFTWVPSSENVSVAGQTVTVDYKDERKFASASASLAKAAAYTLNLTARISYQDKCGGMVFLHGGKGEHRHGTHPLLGRRRVGESRLSGRLLQLGRRKFHAARCQRRDFRRGQDRSDDGAGTQRNCGHGRQHPCSIRRPAGRDQPARPRRGLHDLRHLALCSGGWADALRTALRARGAGGFERPGCIRGR